MDRSRADDVLREWSTVAKSARSPFSSPKPRLTRSALPAGLLAGATLIVAIVFVIGFGSRSNWPVASGSPSPSATATASATASASASASPTVSSSPSATATASQVAGIPATVIASVSNCDITGITYPNVPVISGGDMFIMCAVPDTGAQVVARVNLSTNKLVRTYLNPPAVNVLQGIEVAGGALWVQYGNGSGCSQPCTNFYHVLRVDLVGGKLTLDLVDRFLGGVGPGHVLVDDMSGHEVKLDAATGYLIGQVPSAFAGTEQVCGSLWNRYQNSDGTTSFKRLDPSSGKILASFTERSMVDEPQQVGGQCWAAARTDAIGPNGFGHSSYHFVRITPSGIDFRGPIFPDGSQAAIFDGTLWTLTPGAADPMNSNPNPLTTMQRIDPATSQPAGPIWTYSGFAPAFAADGSLWAAEFGSPPQALDRLGVPLGAIGP